MILKTQGKVEKSHRKYETPQKITDKNLTRF